MVNKDSKELVAQRRITAALIKASHETIILIPHRNDKKPNGGRNTEALPPRDPQNFHIVEIGRTSSSDSRVAGGVQVEDEFTIVGLHNALIDRNDTFSLNNRDWKVLRVEWDNGYEKRAVVRAVG